ncbi:aspartate/glutamate racemase family protein, partial [candidate division WWE3 bacterium]|nr:aspartate/glutamate racemase family protein [candidate division WWE3 bacterium]
MSNVIIGILGGMGPQATVDLYQKIIDATPASIDQEHIHVIIDSYPQIPDRTKALMNNGKDSFPFLLESLKRLEKAGVTHIAIPCNTAHAYIPNLREHTDVEIVSMIESTATFIRDHYPNIRNVGLLATTGTIKLGLYEKEFAAMGFTTIVPSDREQETLVMEAIYGVQGIKAGFLDQSNTELLTQATTSLIHRDAEVIVGGCTEIPLVLNQNTCAKPF